MLDTITNGFLAILDFFQTLLDFIYDIVNAGVSLVLAIPDIISVLTSSFEFLPTVVLSAALFCISVRVVTIILNKKAGE